MMVYTMWYSMLSEGHWGIRCPMQHRYTLFFSNNKIKNACLHNAMHYIVLRTPWHDPKILRF